jgi:hypothetical protein
MKHLRASVTIGAWLLLSAGVVFAGQPGTNNNVNCGNAPATNIPGSASPVGGAGAAQGSPFSGGTSGGVYANAFNGSGSSFNGPPSQNAINPSATSQYDVACLKSQVP